MPKRKPRYDPKTGQMDMFEEVKKRDAALVGHEGTQPDLLSVARAVAARMDTEDGSVSSPDVLAYLRANGWKEEIAAADSRWMGGVFGTQRGWRRLGYVNKGSHCRPVSVWTKCRRIP